MSATSIGGQSLAPNPFSHPFVRYARRGDALVPVESVVYNVNTGERKLCWPIDGKEMVATGGWSFEPVEPKASVPVPAPVAAFVAEADSEPNPPATESAIPAPEFKRGPGRPRKAA